MTKEHSDWLIENGYRSGFIVRGYSSRETVGTYSGKPLTYYIINLALLDDPYWEVRSVEEVGGEFEVFCAEVVDGPPQFTIKGGILTGNCVYEAENLRNLDHKGDGPDIDLFKGGAYDSMIEAYILADIPPSPVDGSLEEGALVERYIPPFHQDGFGYQSPEIKRFMVGLKSLTKFRYNYDQKDIYSLFAGKELTAKQKTMIRFNTLPLSPEVVHYACDDAYLCLQLHHDQMERINEDEFFPNLYKLEMEIAEILVEMREVGITVDWDSLTRYKMQREKFVHELEVKTKKSFEAEIGHALPELNLRSPQQLKNLIFNPKDEGGLGLHGTRTTKSGALSTDDKALGVVRKDSPAVNQLLLHRQAIKTGEWVEAWEGLKNEAWDHKIHPSFIQVRVPSGRFASAGPNCLKGDVDVLTPRGWVPFKELEDGERVAQVDPDNGVTSFVTPSQVIRKPFNGKGVQFTSAPRGGRGEGWLDLWTTPDHRILSYTRDGNLRDETAQEWLDEWEGTHIVDRKFLVGTDYEATDVCYKDMRFASRINISSQEYSGMVYCVTVPTGAFLIRSNGTVMMTGNCQNVTKTWWYQIPGGSKADVIRSGVAGDDYWMGNARAVITASPGYKLLAFDYKSAEIQFVAALAGEQSIIVAFERGDDFHKWAASIMYSKDINLVTKNERQSAKSFSFGNIYQQGIKSLGEQLGVSLEEAQKLQDMYFAAFPHLEAFFENQKRLCVEDHEVRTWLGRKITLWEGMHENQRVRAKAKNIAINAPVQGGATGDYVKIAMVNVRRALKAKGWWGKEVRLLMNQHDSLVFEFSEDIDMQELIDLLTPEVSFSLKGIKGLYNYFEVFPPMSVDWETGYTWGTLEEVGTPNYTNATKLTVEISTKATREDLKAVMDVLTLNGGATPVEIRLGGEVMSVKRGVRPVQAVLDKLKKGDPDNGVYTSPGGVVQAHFDMV